MKQEKRIENSQKMNRRQLTMLAGSVLLIVLMTAFSLSYLKRQVAGAQELSPEFYEEFKRHYAFITGSVEDDYRSEIYEGARKFAEEEKIYLEWLGNDLAIDYSKKELLKMAIASKVDGIILEGDGSEEIQELINKAVEEGIPVVTVMTDSYDSKRQSFVGIGSHNLGREYGRQIIKFANKETERALILMDISTEDSTQSIVFNGIKETLANEGNHLSLKLDTLAISEDSVFGEEEAIRDIFLNKEDLPEIIICLSEENTLSAYQAAVDYNVVGEVAILGYSVNDTILNAISRNVIAVTCVVDYEQMGVYCVEALDEYIEMEHVNDFVTMDVNTVTKNNVARYLKDAEEQNEK